MFGLIYSKNGEIKTYEQTFNNRQDAENVAKSMVVDDVKIFPIVSAKMDVRNGIVDFGECL